MELKYALLPETFKLTLGLDHVISAKTIETYPKNISLCAAKNDTAAFQILLSCDSDVTLNISDSPYFAQKRRPTIRICTNSELDVAFNIEQTLVDDDRMRRADILTSSPICEVSGDDITAVYAEIKTRKNTKPGKYKVTVNFYISDMFGDEEHIAEAAAEITVFNYTMPDAEDNPFYLDLWQHNCNIARQYELEPWSDEHFKILEGYISSLADIGAKTVTLVVSDTPWSGQWCHLEKRNKANLYEYSIVNIFKNVDGSFEYDFTKMQRYIDLCARYHIDSELSVYGLANIWCDPHGGFEKLIEDSDDGHKLRYFDRKEQIYKYIRKKEDIDSYIKALYDYFYETCQLPRVRIVADEPADTEAYAKTTAHIKTLAPDFIFKAAINHSEFIPMFSNTVSDFVPSLASLSKEYDEIIRHKNEMSESRFTWYICNEPLHPNTLLRSDLCETLFIGVLTSFMHMDGFLRWGYTVWTEEPKKDLRFFVWPAGDLCFVYPGKNGLPLLSLRYKALYRAISLCNLLNDYRRKLGDDKSQILYSKVIRQNDIKSFFDEKGIIAADKLFSKDYSDYEEIRRQALEELSQ